MRDLAVESHPNVEEHDVRAPGLNVRQGPTRDVAVESHSSQSARRVGHPAELQRELAPHILHRCLTRCEPTFQLSVLYRCQHLFEAWTGLIACFNQVVASN